ncbi:MAG: transporter substrate-binding domain-containing protein [Bacteroidales bacterium]|nr:transporter substrate-binding domain-containing protein [Bacteroidales bacterium]
MKTINFILACFIASVCVSCNGTEDVKIRDFEKLNGKKIAVQEGTTFDAIFTEKYPTFDIQRVSTSFEIYKAIVAGTAEYGIDEDVSAVFMLSSGLSIDTAVANMQAVPMAAVFNKKNEALKQQFDEFITDLDKSGELNKIREKWFSATSPSSLPIPEVTVTEGEPLTILCEGDYPPFNLSNGGVISGLDAELWTMFANKIGRPIKTTIVQFSDIIPLIAEGKADMSLSGISITEERAKKVLFSKPYNYTYAVIVSSKKIR